MVCYEREPEQELPNFVPPPPECREEGPLFCMTFTATASRKSGPGHARRQPDAPYGYGTRATT